jgi:hypothetical protein
MSTPGWSESRGDSENNSAPLDNPYAILRNRNFLRYLLSRFIASFGQQMLTVAVGWELYERTHAALSLGLVGLTQMLPMIVFTLPAPSGGQLQPQAHRACHDLLTALASLGLTLVSQRRRPSR